MKSVSRKSISDEFEIQNSQPIPDIPTGGARVKVYYAGACYSDGQVERSGQGRPRMRGIQDTSLFPGFEVSGIVDQLGDNVSDLHLGDKVIVYPHDDVELLETGYSDYVIVKDIRNLLRIPTTLSLQLAAVLPCGALMAYSAVQKAKTYVQEKLSTSPDSPVNVLIVGAGGLGLWTLSLAQFYLGTNRSQVHLTVADTSIDKLLAAKEFGCSDVIHWEESLHEEYIRMRIRNVCKGGVDVAVDFVSSQRTVSRVTDLLKQNGAIIVGGNSKYEVTVDLNRLARLNQSIIGVHSGTRDQLRDLINLVATNQIKVPPYEVYPVEEANYVFQQLGQCKISGRAVFSLANDVVAAAGDDDVFSYNNN